MSDKKVWFITGAGRGMGVDIAKAALAAGNAVVATARDPEAVTKAVGEADDLLAVAARHHQARGGRGRRPGGRRSLWPHRRPRQQRRQLQRRLLRGIDRRADGAATQDDAHRADERHPRRPARDAPPAVGPRHHDLVERRPRRLRVRDGLRGLEVRPRRLDGVARPGGRAVRHPHDHRQPGLLPDRTADAGVHQLRGDGDRRLRRAARRARSSTGPARTASSRETQPSWPKPW